ncbi:MAG: ribose 5-phosphate isomerase B [Firmicutes bacterium]|nr:ribose 5-phosphate isomerase B [Bacillota bacterium]
MKIAIGADHAGFELKQQLLPLLQGADYDVTDCGTNSTAAVDYPDYAKRVAKGVAGGEFERGILICGTGLGMCITANKVAGVRAVTVHDCFSAVETRRHNDSNILTLGGRVVAVGLAWEIVRLWLATPFVGGERHERRVEKIRALESGEGMRH